MTSSRRGLLVLATLFATLVPAWTPPAAAQEADATTACERQHVLLLMDESGSLRGTDPEGRRVEAAALLVEALAPIEADRPPVELAVAGFGSTYERYGDFTLPGDRGGALAEVERFRDRNSQANTDYVVALSEAARFFAPIDAPESCKTLIWFTDGGHDLEFPDRPESQVGTYTSATDPGEVTRQLGALVCGPLDESARLERPVRAEVIDAGFRTVISELQIADPSARERELLANTHPVLERLVRSPGDECAVPGEWEIVSEPAQLASSFVERAQQAVGADPVACSLLVDGRLRSDVVESVAFRTEGTGPAVLRVGEDAYELSGRIIDRDIPAAARAAGVPIAVDSDGDLIDCYARFDAQLRFRDEPVLFRDASASALEFIVAGSGFDSASSVGPDLVDLTVTADGQPLTVAFDDERNVWTSTLPTPTSDSVQIEGRATLAAADGTPIQVAALQATISVSETPPAPGLAWTGGTELEGTGALPGTIRVTPQATVDGAEYCVALPDTTLPVETADGAAVAELRAEGTSVCGPADVDQPFDIAAELVIENEDNVTGVLLLPYEAEYVDPSGVRVPITDIEPVDAGRLVLTRAPDRQREALIVAALVLASIIVPLLLLWGANARQGRLHDPATLRVLTVPVTIAASGRGRDGTYVVRRAPDAAVRLEDRRRVDGTRRRWDLPGGVTVARRLPKSPFGTPFSQIRATGPLAASVARRNQAGAVIGPVRFDDAVIVTHPTRPPGEGDPPVDGTAILVTPDGLRPRELDLRLDDGLGRCGPKITFPAPDPDPSAESRRPRGAAARSTSPKDPPPADSRPPSSTSSRPPAATDRRGRPAAAPERPTGPPPAPQRDGRKSNGPGDTRPPSAPPR